MTALAVTNLASPPCHADTAKIGKSSISMNYNGKASYAIYIVRNNNGIVGTAFTDCKKEQPIIIETQYGLLKKKQNSKKNQLCTKNGKPKPASRALKILLQDYTN